ncbi:MAG: hypothetical protein KDE53_31595 [Caldilineaceae bacterium]|nr:hypothetical protein [Caldilineaceae bacterium]
MSLLLDLPKALEHQLQQEADKRERSPEQVALDILASAFAEEQTPTVAEVVARIQATPPNPAMITPPQGSLADALRNGPTDPEFDLERWQAEWAQAEEELRRINLLNDMAEGRA